MNQSLFAVSALALVLVGCDLGQDEHERTLPPSPQVEEDQYKLPPEPTTNTIESQKANHAALLPTATHGVYEGILPCVDCNGVETTLTVNPNDTYVIQKVYVGSDKSPIISSGTIEWSNDGNVIELLAEKSEQNRYFVGNNELTLLDANGNAPQIDELKYRLVQLP
ncbi:copper resistance protein NlpE [Vibrio sp. AK197]